MGKVKIESSTAAKIYINSKKVGGIKSEIKEFELENGKHIIYAKSAWCGSKKVNIEITDNSEICLTLKNFKGEAFTKAIIMALMALFLYTRNIAFPIIAGIILLYPLYHISIGKNQYLILNNKTKNEK